ncbi:MAG: gliding motility-associated C-terminal domain-containing protein [Flavobacteriales bacterium]|nr:gliding motility-associated C-terminal domain-containing protein [Flavobacteriales bacterium]
MKYFSAIFFILFFHSAISQVSVGDDIILCDTLGATLVVEYPSNLVVDGSYTIESIPIQLDDVNSGTTLSSLSDDSYSGIVNIGFDFKFFCNVFNQLIISTNNYLCFNTENANSYSPWSTYEVPNTDAFTIITNSILGPWLDLDPNNGGEIKFNTLGTAPFRRFVVSFEDFGYFSCADLKFNGQIKIFETTNTIEIHIEDQPLCETWNGGQSVLGLISENQNQNVIQTGWNNTQMTANNEAFRFSPSQSINATWTSETGAIIGTGDSIDVNPIVTTKYKVDISGCDNSYSDSLIVFVSKPVTVNPTIDDNLCPDEIYGNIEISTVGGIEPLNYSWNCTSSSFTSSQKNITNVPEGTYQFVITDSIGCEAYTNNFTISPTPEPYVISETIEGVKCYGFSDGSINISVSGGTPTYNYSWTGNNSFSANGNNVINNLKTGVYKLVITDINGCQDSAEYFVPENSLISIESTSSNYNGYNISCNEGSNGWINFIASGGKAPYEYSLKKLETGEIISNESNIQNLGSGQYEFMVNDAEDCPAAHNFEFIAPEKLIINLLDYGNESCTYNNDGFIELSIVGGPSLPVNSQNYMPYKHLWNRNGIVYSYQQNIYGLEQGLYTVNVTDVNNCSAEFNKQITEPPSVIAKYRVLNDTVTVNYPIINLYDDSDGNIIEWYWELSNGITSNEESIFNIDLSAELDSNGVKYYDLKLVVVDDNFCTDSVYGTLAIKDVHTLYVPTGFTPDGDGVNDVFKVFHHGLKNGTFNIRIYDRLGSNIFQSNDPNFEWNGTNMYTNNELITGSYTYVISYQDFEYKIYDRVNCQNCSGTITLVR